MKKITMVLIIVCAASTLNACSQDQNEIFQPMDEPTQEIQAEGCQRLDLACLDQLTSDTAQDGFPAWSPDGKKIVFSRYGDYVAPEKTGLWLVSLETDELQRLTTEIGEHPDWSPDGRSIVYDGEYGNSIQLVSASGGTPSRIVPESIQVTQGGQPIWSPDGKCIAFKEGSNLWVLEVSTGELEKIFSEEGKRPVPSCWSPDGKEIYIFLLDPETGGGDIWALSTTREDHRQVTFDEANYRYADLSPDGALLVVTRCEGHDCELWAMSPDGGEQLPITSLSGYNDGPAWSPDGTQIAFVSRRSGYFDIWLMEIDAEGLQRELAMLEP
jgi:TolB protein